MKKALIITLSAIVGVTAAAVLSYKFIYLRSFNSYQQDTDTGSYTGYGINYDNGTLTIYNPQSESNEIFKGNSKTIEKDKSGMFLGDYEITTGQAKKLPYVDYSKYNGIFVTDKDGNQKTIAEDSKIEALTDKSVIYSDVNRGYFAYTPKTDSTFEFALDKDREENEKIEEIKVENNILYERTYFYNYTEGVFYNRVVQYDINSLREISSDLINLKDIKTICYEYRTYLIDGKMVYLQGGNYPRINSVDLKTNEIKSLGEHKSDNFVSNGKELFFQTDTDKGRSNIYRIDMNTGEEVLEAENVDKDLSIVTDNYIYLYRADIACSSDVPTLEFTIFRGYSVDQIPRNK